MVGFIKTSKFFIISGLLVGSLHGAYGMEESAETSVHTPVQFKNLFNDCIEKVVQETLTEHVSKKAVEAVKTDHVINVIAYKPMRRTYPMQYNNLINECMEIVVQKTMAQKISHEKEMEVKNNRILNNATNLPLYPRNTRRVPQHPKVPTILENDFSVDWPLQNENPINIKITHEKNRNFYEKNISY